MLPEPIRVTLLVIDTLEALDVPYVISGSMGGEVSDRQWRDILGVLSLQQDRLDVSYLRQNASLLKVSRLLERALEQV